MGKKSDQQCGRPMSCARVEDQGRHLDAVHNAPIGVADKEVGTIITGAALEGDARHVRAAHCKQKVLVPLHSAYSAHAFSSAHCQLNAVNRQLHGTSSIASAAT